jgi:hypothetical protein
VTKSVDVPKIHGYIDPKSAIRRDLKPENLFHDGRIRIGDFE